MEMFPDDVVVVVTAPTTSLLTTGEVHIANNAIFTEIEKYLLFQ
jgi:hypothetical protein